MNIADLKTSILNAQPLEFWGATVFIGLIALAGFWGSFRFLRRARHRGIWSSRG